MRLLRSDMIATLQENYITMARAKGLSDQRILWRHALRPSSLTLLTVAGLNFGTLIGGAVAVEVIFQIPGIGTLIYQAINARQIVELQSYIAIIAIGYVLINFAIDALYVVLDPRIRRARCLTHAAGDPIRGLVGDAIHGTPIDAGTIDIAAVETGPRGPAAGSGAGSGSQAWLSIAWLALVVGLAILAPVPADRRPPGGHDRHRPPRSLRRRRHRTRAPPRRRLQRPRHALPADLGRSHDAGHRDARGASSASCSAVRSVWSAATSGARSTSW